MLRVPVGYSLMLLSILLRVVNWQTGVVVAEMKLCNDVESVDRRRMV